MKEIKFAIIFLGLILLLGCIQPPIEPPFENETVKNDTIVEPPVELCKDFTGYELEDCISNEVVEKEDLTLCEDSRLEYPEDCKRKAAIKANNYAWCDGILLKNSCIRNIVLNNGMWQDCLMIEDQDYVDNCLHDVGRSYLFTEACAQIENKIIKDGCYWNIFRAVNSQELLILEDCNVLDDGDAKDSCIWLIAYTKKDLKTCDKIYEGAYRYNCIAEINGANEMCSPNHCNKCKEDECLDVYGCDTVYIYPQGELMEYQGCQTT